MPRPSIAGLISFFSGLILSVPFRDYEGSLPAWLALAPIFWIVAKAESTKWAAIHAAVFSLAWTGSTFSFLWNTAAPGTIALVLYTALYYVGALLVVRMLARKGLANAVLGSAALWVLVELLRSMIPVFGLPWMLLGHTLLSHEKLRQGADLLGVYGLSFLVAAGNACIAFALPAWLKAKWHAVPELTPKLAWRIGWLFIITTIGAASYGHFRIKEISPRLAAGESIGVIQGNVAQKLGRSNDEMQEQLDRHLQLHREVILSSKNIKKKLALICWAETMVPGFIATDDWGAAFKAQVKESAIATLAGSNYSHPEDVNLPPEDRRDYNAAYLIAADGSEQLHYFKRRLVPFGEYIPFTRSLPFLKMLRAVTRDQYTPGEQPSPVFEAGGYRMALNICVEDIHPDLAREAAYAGADTLVNITNDGWFWKTHGPRAHMMAAAWRSIEVRRPLLRVTNTGRTVAVDPLGNVELLLPQETEGTVITELKRIAPRTDAGGNVVSAPGGPVTLYMRLGEWGVGAIFLLIFAACFIFSGSSAASSEE